MIAAALPSPRRADARLLVVSADGSFAHASRSGLIDHLDAGDLLIANDAATLPASLHGIHLPSAAPIEVRLAGRSSLAREDVRFTAVVFGAGDWRTRTEDRPPPPPLASGDRLALGPLVAKVERMQGHERLVVLKFDGAVDDVWAGIARHGRPIQYAYLKRALALWDVWTPVAAEPVAFEAPSAAFALDWKVLRGLRVHGVEFATVTLAAGIASTGDPALDLRLPFDEPYRVVASTASAIRRARARGGRIIAIGTTVVRALEHSGGHAREGVADARIGASTRLRVVDALLSGTHEPGESHYQVLRAFQPDNVLARATVALEVSSYRTHEFGDSVLIFSRRAGVIRRRLESAAMA